MGSTFVSTFDGAPGTPVPFSPSNWDVQVHSRDVATFDQLDPMEAHHGAGCEPPPGPTHPVSSYADAVFLCRDHVMTAINAEGYGMIYLTPNQLVDLAGGEAVISFDVSTLRTSVRDWWDVWITPYEDNLVLPLDLGTDVDAAGPPRRSVRVGLGTENQMVAEVYEDHRRVYFRESGTSSVPGNWWTGYEQFLEPDSARRDTFEIRLSRDHLRVGMPAYDFWWIDADIPTLDWSEGVVQLGHHSYNPTKDCNIANTPRPPVEECTPNTWHWDNLTIAPARPFTIISQPVNVVANQDHDTITFSTPAPESAHLRFSAIGHAPAIDVGAGWQEAMPQVTLDGTREDHFASYWVPIPAGTTAVTFRAEDWYGGPWRVRGVAIWAPELRDG